MKRNILFIFLFIMSIAAVHAQEKKSYTLEDVIPGGNNYANLRPKNITGLQWWGDVCIRADVETINEVDIKTGKETVLVTLDEVNEALQSGEKPYKLDFKIKPLRTLDSASMPWKDRKTIAEWKWAKGTISTCSGMISLRKRSRTCSASKETEPTLTSAKKTDAWPIPSAAICL